MDPPPQGQTPGLFEDGPENFDDLITPDPHVVERPSDKALLKNAEEELKEAPNMYETDTRGNPKSNEVIDPVTAFKESRNAPPPVRDYTP